MRKRYTVKGLALIFALLIVNQGWAQITAQEAIKLMERGINLGNTFDAPNYEGEWAPAAKEYYFEMYAQAGFKTVRVPITWNKRIGTEDPFVIDPIFLSRIDTVISWCLKYDLFVIINVHHDGWIKNTETFDEKKPRFYALWSQLSEHYKDYSEKLMFEIINVNPLSKLS
jgi:endoglucanase